MPEVIYETQHVEHGPWLLSEPALVKLDEIVNTEWETLHRRREAVIESQLATAVEQERKMLPERDIDEKVIAKLREREIEWHGKESRKIVISCRGGKSIVVTTFAEAFRSPEILGEKPKGFSLRLHSAGIQGELELREYSGAMHLAVRPAEEPEARELFVALRRWMLEFRPPLWQRLWKHSLGLHWALWIMAILLGGSFLPSVPDSARQNLMMDGQQLLAGGLDNQEVGPAVAVLLKLAVTREVKQVAITSWFKALLWGGLGISILLSVHPKTSIALGDGARSVKLWSRWVQFLGITLPGLLFGTFVWPYLEAIIRSLF